MEIKKTTVFILCAGDGERWNNYLGIPKQLIKFNSETLLARTIRLTKNLIHDAAIYVVSNDHLTQSPDAQVLKPANAGFTVETFLSTRTYWGEQVIILLGDVFYSRTSIKTIAADNRSFSFYGKVGNSKLGTSAHGEIYAFKVFKIFQQQMEKYARLACIETQPGSFRNLWDLYHSITGLPYRSGAIEKKSFTAINDFTEDFDWPSEFEASKNMYEILARTGVAKKIPVYCKFLIYQIKKVFSDRRFKRYKPLDWKFAQANSGLKTGF